MGVVCAAGPFTLDSDLAYEPLGALLDQAAEAKPDVLILVSSPAGPQTPLVDLILN